MEFEKIWISIKNCAGQEFKTKTGLKFTYKIEGSAVVPDRTNYPLDKRNFEIAAQIPDLQGPGQINDLVRGPSYVYAILSDSRIR